MNEDNMIFPCQDLKGRYCQQRKDFPPPALKTMLRRNIPHIDIWQSNLFKTVIHAQIVNFRIAWSLLAVVKGIKQIAKLFRTNN